MASRVQQDTFMDDSDEACPLCVEEFDLSDKNFRPCPCGYQVCQFCYNNIKNNMNGLCPACRRPYDEKNIEWKIVSPEEFKADVALQARKKAAARQKEAERRQVESLNRKHLAGLRVVQKNLVYVVGLNPGTREEDLLKTLRGDQYFGQYGKIIKIVVSKGKEGTNGIQSMGVYVTFARKEDAAKCIAAVDGSHNGDRILKAQYGTTKYCSAYLRNEICNNRNCMFLHETGEDNDSFSRQDLSSMNAVSTQRPAPPSATSSSSVKPNYHGPPPQPQASPQQALQSSSAASQPTTSQASKDEAMSRSDSGDGSALPTSASWATKNLQIQQSPRSSRVESLSTPSPTTSNVKIAPQSSDDATAPAPRISSPEPSITSRSSPILNPNGRPARVVESEPRPSLIGLERAVKTVIKSSFKWSLDRSLYDDETLNLIDNYPPLFDINGGAVRYAMKKKQEEQRLKREEEERNILQAISAAEEDDNLASGSFQLGGEPETQENSSDSLGRVINTQHNHNHLPQRPFATSSGSQTFAGQAAMANDFTNLSLQGRTLTQQQQQHLLLLRSNNQPDAALDQYQKGPSGNTSLHHPQLSNPFQLQNQHLNNLQGHARQASRYTFANDSASASAVVKPATNAHLMAQQSAMMPPNQGKQFTSQPSQQPGLHTNFYSGIQGPPPGLKSSGTPPISGGGMFGQGHGFASAMGGSLGFGGGNVGAKNSNDDLMRELLRARSGAGSGPGPEAGKREFMFPSFLQQPTASTSTPAPGLLSSLYGPQLAAYNGYQDQGPLKQKKKGKKHRHANTSSSGGGGIVDLADPSILQARMHHGGAGQGPYGGTQGQEVQISPIIDNATSSVLGPPKISTAHPGPPSKLQPAGRIATPISTPPGLSLPQDFPPLVTPQKVQASRGPQIQAGSPSSVASYPVTPAVPTLPVQLSRIVTPTKEVNASKTLPTSVTTPVPESSVLARNEHRHAVKPRRDVITADPFGSPPPKVRHEASTSSTLASSVAIKSAEDTTKQGGSSQPSKPTEKRQRPGRLDIEAAKDASKKDMEAMISQSEPGKPVTPNKVLRQTTSAISTISQPTTPATAASLNSASSAIRPPQPRPLRIVSTPKAETPPRLPASSSVATTSAVPTGKQSGGQPSLGQNDRSGTPINEVISDNASLTSTSISRPSSPHSGKVGSAPVRQSSKSQQKKDRQARAKLAEDTKKSEEVPEKAIPEEPIQAPIVGRLKKAKKAAAGVSADSPSGSGPSSPRTKEDIAQEHGKSENGPPVIEEKRTTKEVKKGSKKEATKVRADEKQPDTPIDRNASDIGEKLHKALLTAASIFADLQRAGELNPSALEIFRNVPGINHRFDLSESDLAETNNVPILSDIQRRLLEQDEAVCVELSHNKRIIVLPDRRTLRGFSREQAQRYLDLRKKTLATTGPTAFNSSRHSINRWLHAPPPPVADLDGNPIEPPHFSSRGDGDEQCRNGRDLRDHFVSAAAARDGQGSTDYWTALAASGVDADEGMPMRVARMPVDEAETAMLKARKDTEALEKGLNALVKKNRRLLVGNRH